MELTLEKNELNKTEDKIVEEFTKELSDSLENNDLEKNNQLEQYREGTTLIREYLGTSVGIPITTCNNEFDDILDKLFIKGMEELSKSEGTIYLLQAWNNKEENGTVQYAVGEYKKGEFKGYQYLPKSKLPEFKEDEEIIFTYNKKEKIEVRDDLKEKMAENFSEELQYLKEVELKRNEGFKREGYIYRATKSKKNENVVYLKDIRKEATIEDLEFSMNDYQKDGLYQVKNGEYVKISDNKVKNEKTYIEKMKAKEKEENPAKAEGFNVEENLEKYNKYWDKYFTTIEEKIGQRLGLSTLNGMENNTIEEKETLEETFMELAKSEKTDIYKCHSSDGHYSNKITVSKYSKDGVEPEYVFIPLTDLPDGEEYDRVFTYNKDGSTTLRGDLKEKAMEITTEKLSYLKENENEELQEFKQEGYLYKYDPTYPRHDILENMQTEDIIVDMDFVLNKEKGIGLYQLVNGEYEKIEIEID